MKTISKHVWFLVATVPSVMKVSNKACKGVGGNDKNRTPIAGQVK